VGSIPWHRGAVRAKREAMERRRIDGRRTYEISPELTPAARESRRERHITTAASKPPSA